MRKKRNKIGEYIDFQTYDRMMSSWLERNKLNKPENKGAGRSKGDWYIHGRSVEEIVLELDKIANGWFFLVETYQGWRNHPTRDKNEGLKASLNKMKEAIVSASNMLGYIDQQSTDDNGQYTLANQRLIIETFKKSGVEAVKKLYQDNDWEYSENVLKTLKGLKRRRIVRDDPWVIKLSKREKNK